MITEEWVPTGQAINAIYYHEVMLKLQELLCKKPSELWKNGFVTALGSSPYSLDLASSDFFLFPKLKDDMKGHHLETKPNHHAC